MRIRDLFESGKTVVSCEVFPPKDGVSLDCAIDRLARLSPAFISVTVHARNNVDVTAGIAADIQREHGIPSMAHMTCVGASRASVGEGLDRLAGYGVQNVLALRGDSDAADCSSGEYRYAEDLIRDIAVRAPGLCMGAACYPEGHIEGCERDIEFLKRKQDAGASFFISQLFFDNNIFLSFIERARAAGVTAPLSAGIMPILSRGQIEKMIFLCGASLPAGVIRLLHKYQDNQADLRRAGIEYTAEQARRLVDAGVDGIHIYTMNKPEVAEWIFSTL